MQTLSSKDMALTTAQIHAQQSADRCVVHNKSLIYFILSVFFEPVAPGLISEGMQICDTNQSETLEAELGICPSDV